MISYGNFNWIGMTTNREIDICLYIHALNGEMKTMFSYGAMHKSPKNKLSSLASGFVDTVA
jgi:hypothetical protein